MRKYFKTDLKKNMGANWWVADFGLDEDGNEYCITTDNVHASELPAISQGAKSDAELCAKLLNMYHNGHVHIKDKTR